MLNPQRLAVFREVAQRGSFTAAADALSYTQSAVSQQISALERETGAVLESRELDLAVVYDIEPPTGALGEELELTPMFEDRYTAVLSKKHRLAGSEQVRLGELAGDVWINTTERDLGHQLILAACRAAGFEPKVAFEVDEIATSQALVARGAGVTLLPGLAIGRRHRDVVLASLGKAAPLRRVYAARLGTRHATPAADAMLDVLRQVAERTTVRGSAAAV